MPIYEIEQEGKIYEVDAPDQRALMRLLGQTPKQLNPGEYDPESPEFQQKYGPLRGNFDNFRAGVGKAFVDLGRGIKQLTGNMSEEEVDEVRRRDAPLMNTKAGLAGNITGAIASALPTAAIPGANTYTGAALIGAGLGGAQPVGTGDSRLQNAAFGAGGGIAGKYVGGKISDWASRARPQLSLAGSQAGAMSQGGRAGAQSTLSGTATVTGRGGGYNFGTVGDDASAGLTAPVRDIMDRGRALGFRNTPGQASGSRALQQLEAKLESQPMTSGVFNEIRANNQAVLNREAAKAIGIAGETLDAGTLDKAFTRLSGIFDDAADDVARPIAPQQFLQKFGEVQDDLRGVVAGFGEHPLVGDLIKHAQAGTATGKQLQSLTSKLGKAAYKQMTTPSGDRDLGRGLYAMKDYVDDLLQQGMSGGRLKTFEKARTQYRNLMMLTSRTGVVDPATGNVSGRTLANVLQQKDKLGYLRGRNESGMYDAARFSKAFAPIVGDSGTATRSALPGATDFVLGLPFNLATRAYASAPSVAVAANAGAASRAVGNAVRPALGTLPYYAPFVLPGLFGSQAPELGRK